MRRLSEAPVPHLGIEDRKVVHTIHTAVVTADEWEPSDVVIDGDGSSPLSQEISGNSAYILHVIAEFPDFADNFGIPRE